MLSTAVRNGKAVSPYATEINASLFGSVRCGTLSTDDRTNAGVPGAG